MAKNNRLIRDYRVNKNVNSLYSITFSAVTLIIFSIQFFRNDNTSEAIDKIIFLGSILSGLFLLIKFFSSNKFWDESFILALTTIVIIFFGLFGIEKHPSMNTAFLSTLWLGFGWPVAILTFLLIPFIYSIYFKSGKKKSITWLLRLLSFLVVLISIPAVLQGGSSIIDPYHSEYVINELLAVPSGNIPYVDFIPQYGQLYSWLISPLSNFVSANGLVTIGLYLMSLGTLVALIIGVWLVYKSMGSKSLPLSILLVVPFTSLTKFPGRTDYAGTIYDLLSAVPGRILPGMLIGLMTISLIISQNTSKKLTWALGILCGLGVWINQDFTFAAGLIAVFLVIIFTSKIISKRNLLIGYLIGLLSYPIAMLTTGRSIRIDSIGFFIFQYTSGYMAEPIKTPGPILIVLPIIISITVTTLQPLLSYRFKKTILSIDQKRSLATACFFSLWSLIGFVYYLNRSYASGQMQILFLPLSVAMASFFSYLILNIEEKLPWTGTTFFSKSTWNKSIIKNTYSYIIIASMMALPLATLIAFPNPSIELNRLSNSSKNNKWPFESVENSISRVQLVSSKIPINQIGFVGNSGNYVELVTGVRSANLLNSPWDMTPAPVPLKVGCSYISSINREYIVIDEVAKRVQELFASKNLCDAFTDSTDVSAVSPYLLINNSGK